MNLEGGISIMPFYNIRGWGGGHGVAEGCGGLKSGAAEN